MNISQRGIDLIKRFAIVSGDDECWNYNLRCFVHSKGRRLVYGRLIRDGKRYRANRYVAILCGENITGKLVCHTCDNTLCCNPNHLFIGTPAENMMDKMLKGRHVVPIGEKAGNAKITDAEAIVIRKRALSGEKHRLIASEFGISQPLVSMLKNGKTRGWQFENK